MKAFVKALSSLVLCGGLWVGLSVSALAQSADPQPTSPPPADTTQADTRTTQAEPVGPLQAITPLQSAQTIPPFPPQIAPDVLEKYEALKAAEQAFLEATRAQIQSDGSAQNSVGANPETPRRSLIPKNGQDAKALVTEVFGQLYKWLTSLPFLAQLCVVIGAVILSPLLAAILGRSLPFYKSAPPATAKFVAARTYIYRTRTLLRAAIMVGLLALAAVILAAIPALGQVWLVKMAQGLAVVLLMYRAIKQFVPNPLFEKVALWTIIPIGLMMVFGLFDNFQNLLNNTELMRMGGEPITLMTVLLLVVFGSLFFKIGNMVNARGQMAIREQETLEVPTQEVVAKIFQILLFTIVFVLVLGAAKVPLSGLVVIFSALSLGIGLGLQPIAANFVSGLIILFDRSVKVGDFVVLPDGQEGVVDAINMRSTIVETYDGKDIMVPNTKFTEEVYENWTHKDPRQRYEVYFSVAYDTDIDTLEGILIPAVLEHHQVLTDPEMPDLELREFGDFGIKFAIEFWCDGVDDGENKFTSDLNFIVWRTLRKHGITMPLPQTEVRMLGAKPPPAAPRKPRAPSALKPKP